MKIDMIYKLIRRNTEPSRWSRGVKYYTNQLVDYIDIDIDDLQNNLLTFRGGVNSEDNYSFYFNSITIDIKHFKIIENDCSCADCQSKGKSIFICKHIVAIVIKSLKQIKNKKDVPPILIDILGVDKDKLSNTNSKASLDLSKQLLSLLDNTKRERVNLDVLINVDSNKAIAEFKIGIDKMYILKNITEFAYSKLNGYELDFGKKFTYNPNIHYFADEDEKLVDIIEEYGTNLSYNFSSSYSKKFMEINASSLKQFLNAIKYKDFTLIFSKEEYHPKILNDTLPVRFDFKNIEDKIVLYSKDSLPVPLTKKNDILLYDGNIYLLSHKKAHDYSKIYQVLSKTKELKFDKEDSKDVLGLLVPRLKSISQEVHLDDNIKNNITKDFKSEFYFDMVDGNICCDVKYIYDDEDKKFVLPNTQKEAIIENKLTSSQFTKENNHYVFKGTDHDLFTFLDLQLESLKEFGDIYYSEKFKLKKIYNASSIQASINQTNQNYLEFNFNISDINPKEYKDILKAFQEKRTFYKLKDGNFIDLSERETKDFFELVENLDIMDKSKNNKIHKNKALYINDVIRSKNLKFIDGKKELDSICEKFRNFDSINLEIPANLNANLRDYQINGLNWFKVLDYYKFGGILADEMGLGKTIQTIAFLLSLSNKKSLIVTPTSLIYNWKNEFEKFAPDIKVLLIHGSKRDREKCFIELENFDVILTTYGTLRNDLEKYSEIKFDYCIIDEAQNIKNPVALVTESVKSINAENKFALTGTPMENNLLELWSIFDFIMPGYLYSKAKFQELFINKEDNVKNLKKLIKPFILRRSKKQVMKELPDKIEKNFFVELNKEQKKIYSVYSKDIQDKMKDKNLKKDKIVIFSYLTKLRQLCLDPSIVVKDYNKKSSKIETCLEILRDSINENHKILLFSQFTSVLKNISKELDKYKIKYHYIDGKTNAKERLELVDEFNNSMDKKVFLISLKAGGTGLNLTSADMVIHFDPWWNPSVENQASDRAHRFGQKNSVQVIKLIAKGTIEEKIIKLQESKKELINQFINGELSNEGVLKSLSDEEIIDLFN
ncbi:DEAD/DEAH box helicase [Clostridioides difficile]|uniref:DEAD/DEAH box helicase n=1 Tax=Clostridioides difficile TaxID=1496 RepID=UPI0018FED9EF|nr:DEAD/DEAH box helicase [Clostridioides difficile]MDL5065103.1 DEAD/DEAH box helicase [Clostridioides difficile]MDN9451950.1 DEAD/DEAH box helicase [Clostridioides difficile]HBF7897131.1 DEAD/DEAH box helicase [Clostridioides difficile]